MVLITNTGKKFDLLSADITGYSNYTEACIRIINSTDSIVRTIFGSSAETRILSIYNDDNSPRDTFYGFTNLIMVKSRQDGYSFIVLKKPEE